MSTITGSPVYPETFVIPDDGSPRDASSVGVPFEALADRTEWLKAMLGGVERTVFNASGTYEVPSQCRLLVAVGYGGGGAGGSGNTGTHLQDRLLAGGGGGGGSVESVRMIEVTPEETLDVIVGAGGNPLLTGLGGSTKVQRSGVDIAIFPGGGAGSNTRSLAVVTDEHLPFTSGGTPSPIGYSANPLNWRYQGLVAPVLEVNTGGVVTKEVAIPPILVPGCGGYGTCDDNALRAALAGTGAGSLAGFAGGASGGTRGSDSVLCRGGGSGGGGGAGPGGSGGAGGKGGDGSTAATSGSAGANGASAPANTGAGGGAGGSGGQGTNGRGAAGSGGAGGSGRVVLYALKVGAP